MSAENANVERWGPFKVWLFSLVGRNPKSNFVAIDMLDLGEGDRLLDLGCGLGAALEYAATKGAEVAGIDPSPTMVDKAAARVPSADVRVASAEKIPFDDDSFTAVLAVGTFHHWADREAGLDEVARVLSPGGHVLVVEGRRKSGGGHGLEFEEAQRVARSLSDRGFHQSDVQPMIAKRAKLWAITATKP